MVSVDRQNPVPVTVEVEIQQYQNLFPIPIPSAGFCHGFLPSTVNP